MASSFGMSSVAFGAPDTYEIFVVLPTNRSLSLKVSSAVQILHGTHRGHMHAVFNDDECQVNGTDRVDALRRRIGAMPELIDASGAWYADSRERIEPHRAQRLTRGSGGTRSIHGWSAPKILLGKHLPCHRPRILDGVQY